MRPTAGASRTASRSAAGSLGSSSPFSAAAEPGTPASWAIAPAVAGASPERTLSATCCSEKNATVSAALGRRRSASTTRPSARTSSGKGGSAPPAGSGPSPRPSASTRRPALASCSARAFSDSSALANRSGAPRNRRVPSRSSALQRRRAENGTWPFTVTRATSASPASLIASSVRFLEGELAAKAASSEARVASSVSSADTRATTRGVGSVSVPVLSVHTTSTDASDSTAFSCCASTPRLAILNADTAAVRLMSRISPSGTRLTSPAVMAWMRASLPPTRASTEAVSPIASGTAAATIHSKSRSFARSRGERGCRNARAVAVSRAARLSSPTAVASNSAAPSTANEPDHTASPAPRTTGSDSPVRLASSSASPSADTTVPSATT